MQKIREIIIEPAKVYVDSTFKIKIKVDDDYMFKKSLVTESGIIIVTENKNNIRTEWGD